MYLIHAQFAADSGAVFPEGAEDIARRCARPADRLEHVVLHPDAVGGAVLGLFLLSASLAEAEQTARDLSVRALETSPELLGFRLLSCRAAVPAAYYDRLLRE
ncbi:hypothetical protein P3T37_002313 [Kitasatospora sp. MAA4]|uniref:hypothetical protein n=1 Tax=Kitasatospora sp. MAA4 TaxID=3035093 RepID=UPI002474B198|nr:hypothetical protein [Kitasatospora sp. MAA4]MDH6132927.1 hypothetical protein [Kitasatospora sp. MAA4]